MIRLAALLALAALGFRAYTRAHSREYRRWDAAWREVEAGLR